MFIVGIDIAKRSHVARIIDSEGRTVCPPGTMRLVQCAGAGRCEAGVAASDGF